MKVVDSTLVIDGPFTVSSLNEGCIATSFAGNVDGRVFQKNGLTQCQHTICNGKYEEHGCK